jgi:endonuclease/exonuclease/phosphatase family metal-dependent hydrolase
MRTLAALSCSLLLLPGCNKTETTVPEPVVAAVATPAAPEPEPEPPKPEDLWLQPSADDVVVVGSFNATYAFDEQERKSERLQARQSKTYEDWEWKRDAIVAVLLQQNLDIIALQGMGGEREVSDVFSSLREAGGEHYDDFDYAFVESTDRASGEHVAILSRYPIFDARRVNKGVKRHVAAEITLPGGQDITVVATSFSRGTNSSAAARRLKGAQTLRRTVARVATKQPVIVMGDLGDSFIPEDDGYRKSVPGVLAGAGGKKDDDCMDSASVASAQQTHLDGRTLDHIISCGLEISDAETSGREQVVRSYEVRSTTKRRTGATFRLNKRKASPATCVMPAVTSWCARRLSCPRARSAPTSPKPHPKTSLTPR